MEKFITAAGCAVRIYDSGLPTWGEAPSQGEDGSLKLPVIFLLHGYLESLEVWDGFVRLLIGHARVLAMDLPGHGISEVKSDMHTMEFLAETVKGVLDYLEVDKCCLVGHSMGGYAAFEFHRKYPERLCGLILFHSTPNAETEQKKEMRLREIEIIDAGRKELLLKSVEQAFAPQNRKRMAHEIADLREIADMQEEAGIKALLSGMMGRGDNNDSLVKSKVPQLFIFGRHDEHIPVEIAATITENHPNAEVQWLEASGHMGFMEEPERSAEVVLDFATRNNC